VLPVFLKFLKKETLIEIETLVHPESRLRNSDLTSDGPGTGFESVGSARHAMVPNTFPKQQECINFSKTLSEYLEKAHGEGKFEKLYIAASPSFLGLLRKNFSQSLINHINGEVDKDMVHLKPEEIVNLLPFIL